MAGRRGWGCLGELVLVGLVVGAMGELKGRPLWPVAAAIVAVPAAVLAAWRVLRRGRSRARERRRLLGHTLAELDRLSGPEFERWIARMLERGGFRCAEVPPGPDYGLDVIAEIDGVRVGIQAKRRRAGVGNEAVQQAIAGSDYHDCRLAAVVTQSRFTPAAVAQAATGRAPVVLIDRASLPALAARLARAARQAACG